MSGRGRSAGGRGQHLQSAQRLRSGGGHGVVEAPAVPVRSSVPTLSGTSLTSSTTPLVAPAPSNQHAHASSSEVALSSELEQKLQLTPAPLPTASSRTNSFRARPGFGKVGRETKVRANHFLVEVKDRDLYHYDVSITPEITSKRLNKIVITRLDSLYRDSYLNGKRLAYDGRKSLYSAGPLPFESKEFVVSLDDKDSTTGSASSTRKERQFKVTIKLASRPDLHQLREYLCKKQADVPYEVIQALDVVLRMKPSECIEYVTVGRSFYSHVLGSKGKLDDGVEYWKGYYQSIRLTQLGLSLNVDVSARPFFEPILVTEFIASYLNIRDFSRPLSDQDCLKIKKVLKSVRVDLKHMDFAKSSKISGISDCPISELTFNLDDQTKFVVDYFKDTYGRGVVKYPNLPAVQAGSVSKPIYFPMELCRIAEGQRYTKRLNEKQVSALLNATCQRPATRESDTIKIVARHGFFKDKFVEDEFGIVVQEKPITVAARVLPPPMLRYHDMNGQVEMVNPTHGQWNMFKKKMINGGKIDYWACIDFSKQLNPHILNEFCDQLIAVCVSKGMQFKRQPTVKLSKSDPSQIEKALWKIHREATAKLQLLIIILPDHGGSYGKIKKICETELGIVSQCCQPRQVHNLNKQYMGNVALKINVKVGGRNNVLNDAIGRTIPLITDIPTIIIGADVTHPHPGEDSSPSIAAVVASMDWPEISKYRALVSAQPHRQEIIQDLYKTVLDPKRGLVCSGLIRELFIAFRRSTGKKPMRIIFYRDGVSEGQFSQVLLYEIDAIRKACMSLENNYLPKITFVVVQKRHHTRLFPANSNNADKTGNIEPGTVVDTGICHPHDFDFYLNSHAGVKGTNRPAHYHVLHDENGFSADELQVFTNNLCYTYARCTRAVSIVPPVYYAHLAAFRARYYIEGEVGLELPAIKENVKDVMFFC